MNHTHKYQHFALDENNDIVDIKNTIGIDGQRYFCPNCHREMITKRGNVRQWHFAHKMDKCSYDKYLHSLAEAMIMKWFNEKEPIMLSMDNYEKCDKYDRCIFYNGYCKRTKRVQYDLKKYYLQCFQEYRCRGFVADLYCENNIDPDSPIFIEIFVTHECSQEKKNSGIRIIELFIQSEEDILNIVNSAKLEESETVRLYNFKRKEYLIEEFDEQILQKYILYPETLKSYVNKECTCRDYDKHRKGIYEISMPYDERMHYFITSGGLYVVGKAKAYLDGYLKKDCQLCKWQAEDSSDSEFCKLYKKCGNPKYCKDNNASRCSMFRENKDVINHAISDFNEHLKNNKVDIWKADKEK